MSLCHVSLKSALTAALVPLGAALMMSCTQGASPQKPQAATTDLNKPSTAASWKLAWSDDFTGTSLNTSKWIVETGVMGLAAEEQYYAPVSNGNIKVSGGILTITAKKQSYSGRTCTSGRIRSQSTFGLGRWEARIKLPWGQGSFPAFWTLTKRWNQGYYGELDILELWGAADGNDNATVWSTCHRNGEGTLADEASYTTPDLGWFNDAYHVFAMEKTTSTIKFFVDGTLYHTVAVGSGNGWPNVTTEPANVILNLAVIYSDSTTPWPMKMQVDYVRFYTAQ